MKLIDVNLLIYATNRSCPEYKVARHWLDSLLSGVEPVALPWSVIVSFLRQITGRVVVAKPLASAEALEVVEGWLDREIVTIIGPGTEHARIFGRLMREHRVSANLVNDAHLAALAIEHGAELCSADGDFSRFKHLRWTNPLAA